MSDRDTASFKLSRRGFFQGAGSGAAALALAASPEPAEAARETDTAGGYAESDHIRTYYETARL